MPRINFRINIKGAKRISRRVLWFLGERAFVVFLTLVFVSLFIGAVIFYYYGFLVIIDEPEARPQEVQLGDESYQQFLENYRQRKANFENTDSKIYFNPFFHTNIQQ
ncbi:hypothetical protein KJ591_00390 [Patescibacteria group bacterium]|nr:hypothetical protein [Patescibacteria group bacterium]MBU4022815.1 hypothetical protein [Patescibacteria group bacterium]MBU4162297.1 hypothetical protein [Patescibacteria group bacterium]